MIPITSYHNEAMAVFGLGASGLATCRALIAGGVKVSAWDDDQKKVAEAAAAGIPIEDLRQANWGPFRKLVLTPGVPLTHPKPHWTVEIAHNYNKEIVGDIDLFCEHREQARWRTPLFAITGTNGKSTTTALIAHLLDTAGYDAQMGGNIGTPILALEPPQQGRCYVIEVSSYQIELAPRLAPTVGVLLNLSPDHLDRHGTMEYYASIKERLVHASRIALVGGGDPWTHAIARRVEAWRKGSPCNKAAAFSAYHSPSRGYGVNGTQICAGSTMPGEEVKIADLAGISTLRGKHNAQNAAAAVGSLLELGIQSQSESQLLPSFLSIPFSVIQRGLETFAGLPHRMEEVGRRGKVLFINDSKATNADSTAQALACFDDIFWIAGGLPKEGGIASLGNFFPRIRKAYLVGEAADDFAAELSGKVEHVVTGTIDRALKLAARDAAATDVVEPVVLLSPACASFDQFRNFEVRGDAFRERVRGMPDMEQTGR